MATYDSLHRQARTLESLFDTKLTAYARAGSSISRGGPDDVESGSGARWRDMEGEVEDLLEKLGETNEQLSALSGDSMNPPSQSMLRAIQRHREVYQDYSREFRRTKADVRAALDQANLLAGVRNDIDAYKSSASEALLAERGRIDSSHRILDETLEQAYETRADISRQRSALGSIQTRMAGVLNTVPGINNLLSMIHKRRRRDTIIIGGLIGLCAFLILFYLFH
ncbi:V-snare-domain-containing protein [Vararia minispora EC-137]|uniref:V-snare-domain-containing protein n=1 Tax=Vararia minispora EC-137 TaxID=1314806 RepID=A0ACB8QQP8_9AGAM|nr:V-snare-domain-containing protein [Vararia minispora EC-137]